MLMAALVLPATPGLGLVAVESVDTGPLEAIVVEAEPGLAGQPLRYIVGFHALPEQRQTYAGFPVTAVDEELAFLVVEPFDVAALHAAALADDTVRYIELDDPSYASLAYVPNDSKYSNAGHWGSKKIGAEVAWDETRGATSVKVAHIDSGLNKAHEEFTGQSRVLQGYDYVSNDNNPQDTSGCSYHGTHTTGTAGATINNSKGIAGLSQHSILPVRAFSGPISALCTGGTTALVNSLKYAGNQGAHFSSNSWGGGTSTAINDAIQYAHDKGTIHIAAAGNSGPCTNCVSEPWKTKASVVIIVASTTSSDAQSSFSSEGTQVDVAAPGSSIYSSTSGTTTYATMSGTSMATPHVTGTAALIKALNANFTFSDIDSRLKNTALDLGAVGADTDFGYGRIQADDAVY